MSIDILWLELTERCNLSCPHCLVRVRSPGPDLPIDFFNRLLSEAVDLGCGRIAFTGGEILLRRDFADIYMSANELGLQISVNTNGTLLSEYVAELWSDRPPRAVKISFYGWNELSYDTFVRRPGACESMRLGLDRLVQRGVPFNALVPAHPTLLENARHIQEFAISLGATGPISFGWNLLLHTRRDPARSHRLRSLRLNPKRAARQKMMLSQEVLQDISLVLGGAAHGDAEDSKLFRCVAAKRAFSVDAYGFLQPCRPLRHPDLLYDLNRGTLRRGTTELESRVNRMRTQNPRMLARCCRCVLRPACSSCPATSWIENGVLDEPVEYYCDILHHEAYWLGLLPTGVKGWDGDLVSDGHGGMSQ